MDRKALFFVCFVSLLYHSFCFASKNPPAYAIVSAHPLATRAGISILEAGGNAFDAAVAVGAVLAVVEPYHSGLGGGGFWLLHQANTNKNTVIDGREVAPLAAHPKMFLNANGETIPDLSLNGGLAAAIPGEPAALVYIAKHYGRFPLTKTLAPAIFLAENGFAVDQQFVYYLAREDRLRLLNQFPSSRAVYLKNEQALKAGECLKQPDLAKTLRLLANKGSEGFYQGEVAQKLVASVKKNGGIWTLADLSAYRIKVRKPLVGTYHSMQVITIPPPSAGGALLLAMLAILEKVPLSTLSDATKIHYIVEAMRLTSWQLRKYLADPDFITVPLKKLLSAQNANYLRALIPPNKAISNLSLSNDKPQEDKKPSTTHIVILDKEGNRVSATMSINYVFGSGLVAEGTGVLLNDEMDDFSIKPGEKNIFGLLGSAVNQIEPGKRPLSSMTPSFIEMPNRVALLGSTGGSRIPGMVLLSTLVFQQFQGAISMVSAMRFHHQYLPDELQFEPDTFSPSLQATLKSMGYSLMPLRQYYGDMQAITWDKEFDWISAAADPRHIGLATVVLVK